MLDPHLAITVSNSWENNCGPLLLTKVVGNPVSWENHPYKTANVLSDVVSVPIFDAHIFLEYASTIIRII